MKGAKSCYHIFLASIKVDFTGPGGPDPAGGGGKWETSGSTGVIPVLAQKARQALAQGVVPALPANVNIIKLCACLSWGEDLALNEFLFGTWPFTDGLDFPDNTGRWNANPLMFGAHHYLYFDKRQVCSPCKRTAPRLANCKCKGFKALWINVTNTDPIYTASDGTKIKLTDPGYWKKTVEQIVQVELAIKLDCAGGGDA